MKVGIFVFIDKVEITIEGGKGGDGAISFRREKYVPAGGPDGGNGGKGGDIVFVADPGKNNLLELRYQHVYKAADGEKGGRKNCTGKSGKDLEISVPLGTIIREKESGKIMADITHANDKRVIIKGGKGGRGNRTYATSTRQAPRYAEPGEKAKTYEVILELKMLADVGIIGMPNAGKSTLLSMVTNANPKVANYHFTTLSPNLGVVKMHDNQFVMADIPGLIEGASEGAGLGHQFLRHIERTKVLIHVVDISGFEGDPISNIETILDELSFYDETLLTRPQVIAANKIDLLEAQDNLPLVQAFGEKHGYKVFPISAATNEGLTPLMTEVNRLVEEQPTPLFFAEDFEWFTEDETETGFTITEVEKGYFVVEGKGVERMIGYTSLDTPEGIQFFHKYLDRNGIYKALREAGAEEGDSVSIYSIEFDYFE